MLIEKVAGRPRRSTARLRGYDRFGNRVARRGAVSVWAHVSLYLAILHVARFWL